MYGSLCLFLQLPCYVRTYCITLKTYKTHSFCIWLKQETDTVYQLFWEIINTRSDQQFRWSGISSVSKGAYYLVPIIIAILAEYFV